MQAAFIGIAASDFPWPHFRFFGNPLHGMRNNICELKTIPLY
jgi:hypothetical protein